MALDPSIAQGFRGMQLESPTNALARVLQIQGLQQNNALAKMQMGDIVEQRKMAVEQARAKAAQDQATAQAIANLPQPPSNNPQAVAIWNAARARLIPVADALKVYDPNFGRQKVTWQDERGPDGRPMRVPRTEFGDVQGSAVGKPYEMKIEDLGGTRRAIDTYTAAPGQEFTKTQSPDNRASVGASMANAAATRSVAQSNVDAARIAAGAKSETDLRKEFADLPEVKKFKNAIPAYQAIVKAAQTNNPQADINLVYGVAKLYDPDSVVREGEYATIANSQAIPEWLKGQAQRLAGGGKLTAETKRQIQEQARIRLDSYKNEYDGAQKSYEGIVGRRGLNAENVFPAVGGQIDGAAGGLSAQEAAELESLRKRFGKKS